MATLVLTAVGTLVGGPIGGAIGALVGQQIDQRLFAPKGRQGPRLGELSVQLSRYGQPIPKLFGTMRVAGSVIWATDLVESAHKSGGGKGKPKVTTYSYSASFAVTLSARPIRGVGRIWADGKLLRGAAGDWKAETGFRLYLGDEEQPVDPLIGAAEGADGTPAYRGIAYAVFEHLQLADFGNRIPSLTFEVEADEGAVTLGAIAGELSGGAVAGSAGASFGGYAASGDSLRGAIEALGQAAGLSARDDGDALRFAGDEPPVALLADELGTPRRKIERAAAGVLPEAVALAYYEPARDYQTGLQRARRGGIGGQDEQIELPAALSADAAKAMAEARLARLWFGRTTRTVKLPWRRLGLRPGERVTLPDAAGLWRVREVRVDHGAIEAVLSAERAGGVFAPPPAAPGRQVPAADALHGPTTIALLDLPPLEDSAAANPRIFVAAAGLSPDWRRAALLMSSDGGASYEAIGGTAAPAVMGSVFIAPGAGSALLFDDCNSIEVELLHEGLSLEGRSDEALIGGANLAMLGDELIQFGLAELVGPARWRLSRLLRGRRGTEWAMTGHAPGERFVLIEADSLAAQELPLAKLGAEIRVTASGIGDAAAVEASIALEGRALRPPSPVHLNATRLGDGTIRIGWVRRSRTGWGWIDGSDAPLGEEGERYRLVLTPSVGAVRTVEVTVPGYDYGTAEQAADGAMGAASVMVAVWQLGSAAASLVPAEQSFAV